VQPLVWRVMLSLHYRLSVHENMILHFNCRQCHMAMDQKVTMRRCTAIVLPVAGCLGMGISRRSLGGKVCVRRSLTLLSRSQCFFLRVTNDPVICLHFLRLHTLRTMCREILQWTSQSGLHTLLLVCGMRLRILEGQLYF
jgi:hypothetical protein